MLNLFHRRREDPTIAALYGAIVAQARQPAFYADYGVPDTVDGRFEMIVLHLALLLRRLRRANAAELSQQVFDRFCTDMDHNLREMGISDVGVPRRMRRFGEAFYGRATAYDRALDEGSIEALAAALERNVFPAVDAVAATRLAAYVQVVERDLGEQAVDAIAHGTLTFPDPMRVAGAQDQDG